MDVAGDPGVDVPLRRNADGSVRGKLDSGRAAVLSDYLNERPGYRLAEHGVKKGNAQLKSGVDVFNHLVEDTRSLLFRHKSL